MNMRASIRRLSSVGLLVAALLFIGATTGQEERITLEQVPAVVKDTILEQVADGEIKEIEIEHEDGRIIYEAEFLRDGEEYEISVAPDGTLLEKEIDRPAKPAEQERKVQASALPPAAMAALKRLADGAPFTEFAEEVEHGSTFYEGSWKAPGGTNVDALVTPTGDLVELEEQVAVDKVPAAIVDEVKKTAGPDASLFFEKKTMILYEVKFRKENRRHEILYAPDGRMLQQESEAGRSEEGD